ncbi:hypothetical protein AMS68_007899 [Peltaster fructicola]|uniref:DUF2293 domain-containing protein n=1 Tax=Peltaster fructicola TaxID=286661 RepID=A0A6H0Y5R6_9PEZI|nr:hypothetical protein AMS68_007899 [Peltaster fructicola]
MQDYGIRTARRVRSEMLTVPKTDGQDPETERTQKREWNRSPLRQYFPRIPDAALERLLDICIDKGVTYNLSQSKIWNMRRLTSIVVAHVRHNYSDYDQLLRDKVDRFDARFRSAEQVWTTLRQWCPWDDSNEVLERCVRATLVRPEDRGADFDPMDIDEDSDDEGDPMDLS